VKANEISFWLEWYSEWQDAIESGSQSVEEDCYFRLFPRTGFEKIFDETILRLVALLERACDAPVPESFLENWNKSTSSDEAADPAVEGTDWPAPSTPTEAAMRLTDLLREPRVYVNAKFEDPLTALDSPLFQFEEVANGIRAAQLIESDSGEGDVEREDVARSLRITSYAQFLAVKSTLNFLRKEETEKALELAGLGREAMTPFHRFVDADLSLDRLIFSYVDLLEAVHRSDMKLLFETDDLGSYVSEGRERCACGADIEDEEVDLGGSCWDCQCM